MFLSNKKKHPKNTLGACINKKYFMKFYEIFNKPVLYYFIFR